jgi:hypothetical protein
MAKELTKNQPQQTVRLLSYSDLFATLEPLHEQIKTATARLGMVVDRVIPSPTLEAWAQTLGRFSPKELAAAFDTAELTLEAWPTPAKVAKLILDGRFFADHAWLMRNLKEHGPTWKDSSARLGDLKRIPGGTPDDFYPRDVLEPEIPAPTIPPMIARTLDIFGHGNRESALRELYGHPDCKGGSNGETVRARRDLDSMFRSAWDLAKSEVQP